jgi:hypothetical protein
MGFDGVSLVNRGALVTVILWHPDSSTLAVSSKMFDVDPDNWTEIGYLAFQERVYPGEELLPRFPLPRELHGPLRVSKLVLKETRADSAAFELESGLDLSASGDEKIIIVSGGQPYTIAIFADFIDEHFIPEYDLTAYAREPLSRGASPALLGA